jgi:hypothetical protein
MAGHTCYHCKSWVEQGEAHDCWTTTEAALTKDLSEDLRDAWERLRETAADLGEQRIYASHHSIMFARRSCYCFVRPKRSFLEVIVFLPRVVHATQVKRVHHNSKTRRAHTIQVRHRDEVEAPITDWLREAYDALDTPSAPRAKKKAVVSQPRPRTPKPAKPAKPALRPSTQTSKRAAGYASAGRTTKALPRAGSRRRTGG